MKRYNINIEELIRKEIQGIITAEENDTLKSVQKCYSEEEFDRIVITVLQNMEDPFPKDPLKDWEPDYEDIICRGNIEAAIRRKSRHRKRTYKVMGIAAAMLVFLGMGIYVLPLGQKDQHLDQIPVSESAYTLSWGDQSIHISPTDTAGRLAILGDVLVVKHADGLLAIEAVADRLAMRQDGELIISTEALQQCVVQLPNGARVRLDAQSSLRYPLQQAIGDITVQTSGYALIDMPKRNDTEPLIMKTDNGYLKMSQGTLSMIAVEGWTQATSGGGEATLATDSTNKEVKLDCRGAQGILVRMQNKLNNQIKDSLFYSRDADFERESRWARALRKYDGASVREYIVEMSRWYGIKVKDIHCIPTEPVIDAAVRYTATKEEMLAAVQQEGVRVHRQQDLISFCPEDIEIKNMDIKSRLAKKR
ncbi:FecR family protein [Sphingobacterium faecale]|uniref:FecR domain-containing protein n=1 Tax=Sphingobacterium faecale TaxID=2803775 RepID=A0ABS1R2R4_9SPHI|nr:FecR domain-containing protein [Sphingobacterium faecale]MBL1408995.1 FecR domain-containing protein [Sphingobacterium faecale]